MTIISDAPRVTRAVRPAGESSEEASGSDEDVASWISWFCSLKGNEFFCEVEEDFIQDDFNLSGLSSLVNPRTRLCCDSREYNSGVSLQSDRP